MLSFCAHVAARLPFKRCDEPYTLLHLINATISRRAAFVLSAQKAALDATLQQEAQPAADATTTASHQQEGHAGGHAGPQGSGAAAPEDGDRAVKGDGGAQRSTVGGGAEAAPAETPGSNTGDRVGCCKPCLYMVLGLGLWLALYLSFLESSETLYINSALGHASACASIDLTYCRLDRGHLGPSDTTLLIYS